MITLRPRWLPLLLLLPLLDATATRAEDPLVTNPPPAVDPAFLDAATKPGDDFFTYANGGWLKHAVIPGDRSSWGITQEMDESNENVLHKILDDCAAGAANGQAAPGTPRQKVGDLYRSGMDVAAVNAAGLQPMAPWFDSHRQTRRPRRTPRPPRLPAHQQLVAAVRGHRQPGRTQQHRANRAALPGRPRLTQQ